MLKKKKGGSWALELYYTRGLGSFYFFDEVTLPLLKYYKQ